MELTPGNCPYCRSTLPQEYINTPDYTTCPFCGTSVQVFTFPALHETIDKITEEITKEEGQASCFYHHDKKAHEICHLCGRFICPLCDIELDDQHICPECIGRERKKGTHTRLQNHHVLYDNIALFLALSPAIFFFPFVLFSFITAPVALYVSIRYWNTPGSILRNSKSRFILAIILSVPQILGWIILPFTFFM